jgi:retinol-binding protein 3
VRVQRVAHRCIVSLLLLLSAGLSAKHGYAQVTVPDTPAGHTLQAWLDAFNSANPAKLDVYIHTFDPKQSADGMLRFYNATGGFELLSIESSEPLHIRFRVKEKSSSTIALGNLLLKSGQPPVIANFGLRALPPGAVLENVVLDAALRKQVINGIEDTLNEYYVEPTMVQQMADALNSHEARADYDAITDGDVFAAQLTKDLQDVSHDKHLNVNFSPFKIPPQDKSTPEDDARFHRQMEHDNCAFDKVEILPNNIGYIKFDAFMDASFCGPTVVAAMAFVAHTDAIILDLRQNGGGQPAMVTLIASYLFDKPTHLIDIYNRKENSTTQNWTLSYLPGQRLAKQPAFVLTSKHTFSGAEEFAFDLKNQKRATIVGETTGGGAHPVDGHTVADYFTVGVPFAKSLDPLTKTNWEGTGVEPDVKVPASDALDVAIKLADSKITEMKK